MAKKFANIICIILIAWAVALIMNGCAAVGYVASAGGAIRTEVEMQALQERIEALENGDIW